MDDLKPLQRTIRRVGSVLAALIGALLLNGGMRLFGTVVIVGAVLFLVSSLVTGLLNRTDPIERTPEESTERIES